MNIQALFEKKIPQQHLSAHYSVVRKFDSDAACKKILHWNYKDLWSCKNMSGSARADIFFFIRNINITEKHGQVKVYSMKFTVA